LQIKIVEKPPYDGSFRHHNLDEGLLESRLKQSINYKNISAVERDVASISAIMRLRKSQTSYFIESCQALFITTNRELFNVTRQLFCGNNRIIPPVLPHYILTN